MEIEEEAIKAFRKLGKKDRKQLEAVKKKIQQILEDPLQFKPLKRPLEGLRRVHVGSFVLIHEVFENPKRVRVLQYRHHDEAYV